MAFNTAEGRATYTALSAQTEFTFTFKVFTTADIKVYQTLNGNTPNDTTDLLTLTTDYTVSINGDNGGTITLNTGASTGDTITLVRDLDVKRDVDYQDNGDLLASTLDSDQNYQTYLIQQALTANDRTIRLQDTTDADATLPAPNAGYLLRWNVYGDAIDTLNPTDILDTTNTITVETITDLSSIDTASFKTAIVKDLDRGGTFIWSSTGTANDGTVFAGATGYWTRQYSGAVSVKWFGAVGDGITDDAIPIQNAVNTVNVNEIYFPTGTYYSSLSIKLKHTGSYYRRDTGQIFSGDGIKSVLTRKSTGVQGAESTWSDSAFFSCYGSYNEFNNLQLTGCDIAIYFGQDPTNIGIELSHTSFNKMQNLLIQNCGTGILSACSQGHYYNNYKSIHISQCQIAVYFTVHSSWTTPLVSNNNRNTFLDVRASRCQVGFWLANGDTNSVYSFHCEGCGVTPTNNTYTTPSGLPAGLTSAAFVIDADNNDFYGCFHESCDFYIYHNATGTQSFGNLFRINEDPAKQNFVTPMYNHFDRYTAWLANGSFALISNVNSAFPNTPAGHAVTKAVNGGYAVGTQYLSSTLTSLVSSQLEYGAEYVLNLGAIAALGTTSITLWSDIATQVSSSSVFEITVIGNCQTSSLVHSNTFKVIALRNASRSLTRTYVYDQSIGRATGLATGDGTEPIVPTVSVSVKDLILTLTMPNRNMQSVAIIVKQLFTRG